MLGRGLPLSHRPRGCSFILTLLAVAGAVHPSDVTSGSTPAGPNAWIDVPVFWINVDAALMRAAKMRAQLTQVLLPGVMATRVPAITLKSLNSTVGGGLLMDPAGTLRFTPSTSQIEIAVMASHLKAIFFGSKALGTGHGKGFLVLEDDVDLLFFPKMRTLWPDWPTSQLDGLLNSLPEDSSSIVMLMVIARHLEWRRLWEIWEAEGHPLTIRAERLTLQKESGCCSSRLWAASAYLVSGSAAAEVLSIWPASETATGSFQLDVSRSCWTLTMPLALGQETLALRSVPHSFVKMPHRLVKLRAKARRVAYRRSNCAFEMRQKVQSYSPMFISDSCLLHYESSGPAMSYETMLRVTGLTSGQQGFLSQSAAEQIIHSRQQTPLQTYVMLPPPVVSRDSGDGLHEGGSLAANHTEGHVKSTNFLVGWWDTGRVPEMLLYENP
mmetsp:Transcript_49484/g.115787  ORF Transcript_49484/g.115787 Transcript_49484/m.115787 type:complete len:440 (-) Transcript_49484:444-1763(-)